MKASTPGEGVGENASIICGICPQMAKPAVIAYTTNISKMIATFESCYITMRILLKASARKRKQTVQVKAGIRLT